jgi:transposase
MKAPIYVRELTAEEHAMLAASLRSKDAFTLRRAQILLASAERQTATTIGAHLQCATQTVRNALHAFEQRGVECLQAGSNVPLSVEPVLTAEKRERLRVILHQSPRTYGKARSVWTLTLLAEVCQEQGLSACALSAPTILDAVVRLGTSWKRAKHWIVSPDPDYALKKTARSLDPVGGKQTRHRAGFRR